MHPPKNALFHLYEGYFIGCYGLALHFFQHPEVPSFHFSFTLYFLTSDVQLSINSVLIYNIFITYVKANIFIRRGMCLEMGDGLERWRVNWKELEEQQG